MPKVSVIIPVYNVAAYLLKSVRSVMEQTERDIEIILVDDGSTDGSGALCDAFAREDPRIRVIHKENGGLSSARNAGIAAARGNYVLLLDGDDYLLPDAAERVLQEMERSPSDLIQFHYQEVAAGEEARPCKNGECFPTAHTPGELFQNLYRLGGEGASACTKLFRRELLERFPFEPVRHEDEMWCTRAYVHPLTVTYIPDVLYCYVMRENSIVHSTFNPKKLNVFEVSEERVKALEKLQLNDLLHFEYERIFYSVVRLYCEARDADDDSALGRIMENFLKYRKKIEKYAMLKGRYGILFKLMSVNYSLIEAYRLYRKARA